MSGHPTVPDLVERSGDTDVAAHLAACAPCRARSRALVGLEQVDADALPGIDAARQRLTEARRLATFTLTGSLGGTPEPEPDDLSPGRDLGRYRVEALVGRGGMGAVYRVRHVQLGSVHALKLTHRASRAERERLVREGQAQGRMRHAHVVSVTDIIDVDGAPGLILEFVDGPTLQDRLRAGPVPLELAERIAVQILRGVAAAHAAGFVHRDLKPSNVLLAPSDEGPVAKVTDFGLARRLDAEPEHTRSNGPLGTPAYMAPEQIRDPSGADARSDVFSLGAVLYELLTGRRAFAGLDVADVFDRVRAGRYEPIDASVPPHLAGAVRRALSVDPADRFADCHAFLAAWRGAPEVAPAPGRRPRWGVVAAALAAAAVVAVAVAGWSARPTAQGAVGAPAERRLTALPTDLQVFDATLSADGRTLVFTDGRGLWRQAVDGGTEERLMDGGAWQNVDVFPDGARVLVSGWRDGEPGTWTVPIGGGAPALLFPTTARFSRVSPDGTRLLFVDDHDGVWLQPLDGGARVPVRSGAPGEMTVAAAWSPSGRQVATVRQPADGSAPWLEVTSADGRATRRLVSAPGLVALGLGAVEWVADDTLLWVVHDFKADTASLFALTDAETRADAESARRVHTWSGFYVTRLRGHADRLVVARASSRQESRVLALERPSTLLPLSRDGWSEKVVGWRGAEVLTVSDRGGGGVYRQRLDEDAPSRLLDALTVHRMDAVGDDLLYLRAEKQDDHVTALFAERRRGDAVDVLWTLPVDPGQPRSRTQRHAMRCRSLRCLVSEPVGDELRFWWLDAETGARGAPVLSVDGTPRWLSWDLSPDERRVAIVTSAPRLIVAELDTGLRAERRGPFELPAALAWSHDGTTLFASGLSESNDAPYQIVAFPPDGPPVELWRSHTAMVNAVLPSPDGAHLAIGLHAFAGDLWLLELP